MTVKNTTLSMDIDDMALARANMDNISGFLRGALSAHLHGGGVDKAKTAEEKVTALTARCGKLSYALSKSTKALAAAEKKIEAAAKKGAKINQGITVQNYEC